jgi:hypothetical protein
MSLCELCGKRANEVGDLVVCVDGHVTQAIEAQATGGAKEIGRLVHNTAGEAKKKYKDLSGKELAALIAIELFYKMLKRVGAGTAVIHKYLPLLLEGLKDPDSYKSTVPLPFCLSLVYLIKRLHEERMGRTFLFYDFQRFLMKYDVCKEINQMGAARGGADKMRMLLSRMNINLFVMQKHLYARLGHLKEFRSGFYGIGTSERHLEALCAAFGLDASRLVVRFKRFKIAMDFLREKQKGEGAKFPELYVGLFLYIYLNTMCKLEPEGKYILEKNIGRTSGEKTSMDFWCRELHFSSLEEINYYLLRLSSGKSPIDPEAHKGRPRYIPEDMVSRIFARDLGLYIGYPTQILCALYRKIVGRYVSVLVALLGPCRAKQLKESVEKEGAKSKSAPVDSAEGDKSEEDEQEEWAET